MKTSTVSRKEQKNVEDKFRESINKNKSGIIGEIKNHLFKDKENIGKICQDYRKYGDIIALIKGDIQRERENIL